MPRTGQDDPDQEKKDAHVVEEEQEEEKLLESEAETEKSPQEKLGNSFLADMVNPLFGVGVERGPRQKNNPDDEIVDIPSGDPEADQKWDDVLFGHPEWVPPKRRVLSRAVIDEWLPPPLPDPMQLLRPPGVQTDCAYTVQPYVTPCTETARAHHDTWIRVARDWLDAAALDEFDHMADAGARVLAGTNASRARVLAVRFAAVALGMSNLEPMPIGYSTRFDLESFVPHLDNMDRAMHAEGAKVPSCAALVAGVLNIKIPRAEVVFPNASDVAHASMMTMWGRLLCARGGRTRLSPVDLVEIGHTGPGAQPQRDALEDRATSLYSDILRLRVRVAGAAQALFAASRRTHGNRAAPGLYATMAEVDRHTESLLNMLRQLGMGLYASTPWSLERSRQQLLKTADTTDRVMNGILTMMSRWTSAILVDEKWPPEADAHRPLLPTEESLDALNVLKALQHARPDARTGIAGPFSDWAWIRTAAVLTAADQFALEGDLGPARALHVQLVRELWDKGDPAAMAVALTWEPPVRQDDA